MNSPTYRPSKPCKRGHFLRYVKSGDCLECMHLKHKTASYKAKARSTARKNYRRNRAAKVAQQRAKRAARREHYRRVGRESMRRRAGLPRPTRPCPAACENCNRTSKAALSLDHDHTTGEFRGWLCAGCNTGIGRLGDTAEGLERALAYLRRANG